MRIGDLYNRGNLKGVVISVDTSGVHGLILSLKRHHCQWYDGDTDVRTGARDPYDGKTNQDYVLRHYGSDCYPAFKWCSRLGDGWYLPAIEELRTLCDSANLNAVERTLKSYGDPLYSGCGHADLYLSSTEGDCFGTYDTDHLMVQVFCVSERGGSISSDTKRSDFEFARAVHRF